MKVRRFHRTQIVVVDGGIATRCGRPLGAETVVRAGLLPGRLIGRRSGAKGTGRARGPVAVGAASGFGPKSSAGRGTIRIRPRCRGALFAGCSGIEASGRTAWRPVFLPRRAGCEVAGGRAGRAEVPANRAVGSGPVRARPVRTGPIIGAGRRTGRATRRDGSLLHLPGVPDESRDRSQTTSWSGSQSPVRSGRA